MYLYKFSQDFDYSLRGVFIATPAQIANIIDKEVCFGDVFNDYTDIEVIIKAEDITLITSDSEFISQALELDIVPYGLNPLLAYVRPD